MRDAWVPHGSRECFGGNMKRDLESEIDRAFAAYRTAAVVPDASPAFTTDIWAAIEARRTARTFGMWAKVLTSGALAASLMLGVLSARPERSPEPEYLSAYLEANAPVQYDTELAYAILESEQQR